MLYWFIFLSQFGARKIGIELKAEKEFSKIKNYESYDPITDTWSTIENFEDVEIVQRIDKKRSFFDFIFNVLSNKLDITYSHVKGIHIGGYSGRGKSFVV